MSFFLCVTDVHLFMLPEYTVAVADFLTIVETEQRLRQ